MLGTRCEPVGTRFSDYRGPIVFDSRDAVMVFSDCRDPIFNSTDPNRVPKTPLKKLFYSTLVVIKPESSNEFP